jgi:hypothetical protein
LGGNCLKLVVIDKVLLSFTVLFVFIIGYLLIQSSKESESTKLVMGGILNTQLADEEEKKLVSKSEDVETYFRPSDLPVLNNRQLNSELRNLYLEDPKKLSEIDLPKELMTSLEETIINYFSVLRDAANVEEGKDAGCGTLGESTTPYPIAYKFLSSEYQKELPYKNYLNSFKNILHTSLIKYKEVPVYDNPNGILRYFVELETIGGSEGHGANFTYYYGFVDLVKENNQYRISNLDFTAEDYLCAPFHGWSYDAESSVQIRYGGWCELIKERYPTVQDGYVKHIYFSGTDGKDYMIEFFQLTNDTDIEIAQYRRNTAGDWERIKLNPEECLEKNKKHQQ